MPKNDLEKMTELLERNGYAAVPVGDGDESRLATKEFMVVNIGTQEILCLGAGMAGDSGCHMKFYFSGGSLMNHGCFEPEEE